MEYLFNNTFVNMGPAPKPSAEALLSWVGPHDVYTDPQRAARVYRSVGPVGVKVACNIYPRSGAANLDAGRVNRKMTI